MNIRKFIRERIGSYSISEVKAGIKAAKPNHNPFDMYIVEDEWLAYRIREKKDTVEALRTYIATHSSDFHDTWRTHSNKLQKFYNKISGVASAQTITGTTVRQIATGKKILDENRTFGIEIEFNRPILITWDKITDKLWREEHIHAKIADRTDYADTSAWRLTSDGSVQVPYDLMHSHAGGNEIKSPILKGEAGLNEIRKVLKVLKSFGCIINNSCGLHVHHGFKNKDDAENARIIHNACLLYNKYKGKIARILPKDRRHNKYCRNFRPYEIQYLTQNYGKEFVSQYDKMHTYHLNFCNDRMRAVNIMSYATHGTLEFRQHSGTLDEIKVINWILLTQAVMNTAEDYFRRKINLVAHSYGTIHNELGLNNEVKDYIKTRTDALRGEGKETEYVGEVVMTGGFRSRRRRRW